jgi:protein involved in polysaccharide export with SLBB domain
MTRTAIFFCLLLCASCVFDPVVHGEEEELSNSGPTRPRNAGPKTANVEANGVSPDYVLGPGDQISLIVPGIEDQFNEKLFRIDASGDVTLPLVGRIHASGLSTAALEACLRDRFTNFLKDPRIVVNIAFFGSEPVSILGAVKNPGIIQLQGRKNLFEVLSMAGGLQPGAGYLVQVTRSLQCADRRELRGQHCLDPFERHHQYSERLRKYRDSSRRYGLRPESGNCVRGWLSFEAWRISIGRKRIAFGAASFGARRRITSHRRCLKGTGSAFTSGHFDSH